MYYGVTYVRYGAEAAIVVHCRCWRHHLWPGCVGLADSLGRLPCLYFVCVCVFCGDGVRVNLRVLAGPNENVLYMPILGPANPKLLLCYNTRLLIYVTRNVFEAKYRAAVATGVYTFSTLISLQNIHKMFC